MCTIIVHSFGLVVNQYWHITIKHNELPLLARRVYNLLPEQSTLDKDWKMKNTFKALLFGLAALVLIGCEEDNQIVIIDDDPLAPQGVYSITGDNAVYVYWNGPYERDIDEYWIYRSLTATTGYTVIGARAAVSNPNLDLVIYEFIDNTAVNGQTYFYAVASVDGAGQVSELSAEEVFDTPRPEGNAVVFDVAIEPTLAGYDLSSRANVRWDSSAADIYIDRAAGTYYINVADAQTDLQDVGYTDSFDDIGYAPTDGWSENGWAEIIAGHIYIVWTRDLNYAKMRVESINSSSVSFRWAYQTDPDNPELIVIGNQDQKPQHGIEYIMKPKMNNASLINGK